MTTPNNAEVKVFGPSVRQRLQEADKKVAAVSIKFQKTANAMQRMVALCKVKPVSKPLDEDTSKALELAGHACILHDKLFKTLAAVPVAGEIMVRFAEVDKHLTELHNHLVLLEAVTDKY